MPQLNDVGIVFELTVKDEGAFVVDLSSATTIELIFRDPDGTSVTQTATFTTDGSDGKIQYTTLAGDLDVVGLWSWQGHVVIGTSDWRTSSNEFRVLPNLTSL